MITRHLQDLPELLAELKRQRAEELAVFKRNGGIVSGYFCLYTPVEVIEACGAAPVRIMDNGGHAHETQGSRFIRSDSCSFCKASLGALQHGDSLSCIVSGTSCDQMRRLHEITGDKLHIPTYLFCSPRTYGNESAARLFHREILWVIDEITQVTGKSFSEEILRERVAAWNELRRFLRSIHDARRAPLPPVTGREMFDLADTAYYLGPDRFLPHAPEIEKLIFRRRQQYAAQPLRIMLAGSILSSGDRMALELIEQDGAAVVSDIMCTGVRWFINPLPMRDDPLRGVCDYYHTAMICPHRRPNDPLFDFARSQIGDWNVQGIICRTLKFCHPWTFEVKTFNTLFSVPVLHLDTDYSLSGIGQVRTRIQAFLEMIGAKRGTASA